MAHLRSSSRSHSVWCLTCNLLSCSPWVCFSSWVTRTWRRNRQVQNWGESGLNSDSSARNWCWSGWIFSLPVLSGAKSCHRWILVGCRMWRLLQTGDLMSSSLMVSTGRRQKNSLLNARQVGQNQRDESSMSIVNVKCWVRPWSRVSAFPHFLHTMKCVFNYFMTFYSNVCGLSRG